MDTTLSKTEISKTEMAHVLRGGAVILDRSHAGALLLTDADRVDFLQRMTSNDIARLQAGNALVTVLTSSTARIVHVFTVLSRADALVLLPAPRATPPDTDEPSGAAALAKHLRSQIFFMDKVRVQDVSADYTRLRVVGAQAAAVVQASGIEIAEAEGQWRATDDLIALTQAGVDLPGVELLIPAARSAEVVDRLAAQGARRLTNAVEDLQAYSVWRIALGLPAAGKELTGDYNPLEAGMAWACADNKGCYTGQEIIARQQTYDKVTRSLVGVRSSTPIHEGAAVSAEGKTAGTITSAAWNPALQAWTALAIVKRPWNTPGAQVVIEESAAEVVALPFATTEPRQSLD